MSFTLFQSRIVYISTSFIVFKHLSVESIPGGLHSLAISIDTAYNNINYKIEEVHDIINEEQDKSNPSNTQVTT